MCTHNLCFEPKIRKMVYLSFTLQKYIRRYTFHGHVFLMFFILLATIITNCVDLQQYMYNVLSVAFY